MKKRKFEVVKGTITFFTQLEITIIIFILLCHLLRTVLAKIANRQCILKASDITTIFIQIVGKIFAIIISNEGVLQPKKIYFPRIYHWRGNLTKKLLSRIFLNLFSSLSAKINIRTMLLLHRSTKYMTKILF